MVEFVVIVGIIVLGFVYPPLGIFMLVLGLALWSEGSVESTGNHKVKLIDTGIVEYKTTAFSVKQLVMFSLIGLIALGGIITCIYYSFPVLAKV